MAANELLRQLFERLTEAKKDNTRVNKLAQDFTDQPVSPVKQRIEEGLTRGAEGVTDARKETRSDYFDQLAPTDPARLPGRGGSGVSQGQGNPLEELAPYLADRLDFPSTALDVIGGPIRSVGKNIAKKGIKALSKTKPQKQLTDKRRYKDEELSAIDWQNASEQEIQAYENASQKIEDRKRIPLTRIKTQRDYELGNAEQKARFLAEISAERQGERGNEQVIEALTDQFLEQANKTQEDNSPF